MDASKFTQRNGFEHNLENSAHSGRNQLCFFLKPRDVTQLVECVPSTQKTWVQFLEPQLLDIVAHISARWRQENQDVNDGGHPWLHRELEANQACMRLCLKKGRGQFFA